MSNIFVVPVLISVAIVLVVFMMKKNEQDESKKPNYTILFVTCLVLSSGIVYCTQTPEDNIHLVMREIDVGDAPW